jgi:hypothetical protein
VHLLHRRDVLNLEIEAVPQAILIFGVDGNLVAARALQPREIDPWIGLRMLAEGAMSGKRLMPAQEDQSVLHGRAQQAVCDGGDHDGEPDGQ